MGSLDWLGPGGSLSSPSSFMGSHHEHGVLLQEEGFQGGQPIQALGTRRCSGEIAFNHSSDHDMDIISGAKSYF